MRATILNGMVWKCFLWHGVPRYWCKIKKKIIKINAAKTSQHTVMILKVSVSGTPLTIWPSEISQNPIPGSLGKSDHSLSQLCCSIGECCFYLSLKPPQWNCLLIHCPQRALWHSMRCCMDRVAYVLIAQPFKVQVPERQNILLSHTYIYNIYKHNI